MALAVGEAAEGTATNADQFFQRLLEANTEPGADAFKVRSLYGRLQASRSATARSKKQDEKAAEFGQQARALFEGAVALAGDDRQNQVDARVQLGRHLLAAELTALQATGEQQDEVDSMIAQIKAIFTEEDLPEEWSRYTQINLEYFEKQG